jgi:hypothetical protein
MSILALPVGTRSVLYGAHQFLLHPIFVALAWWRLYGFPRDARIWIAFYVHDVGYIGKPNMDGPEGEMHVEAGAKWMERWFGPEWGNFCRYHSRSYADRDGQPISRLCVADKFALVLTPWWLYLPMARATGEIHEYRRLSDTQGAGKYARMNLATEGDLAWYRSVQDHLKRWVEFHRGDTDTVDVVGRVG